jgi:hypothetical protein
MHNQHAGLSQQLAAQRIAERHQQAAQARLAQHAGRSRRRHHRRLTRRWWQLARRPGTALTRALLIGAMGAAMHLAATTTLAHAHATDSPPGGPPTERRVGESWRHRQTTAPQQRAAEATRKRVQARERFSVPNATPAQAPAPAPPNQPGPSDRLVAWLGGLAAALALAGGLGVHATRRTRRRARLEHAA